MYKGTEEGIIFNLHRKPVLCCDGLRTPWPLKGTGARACCRMAFSLFIHCFLILKPGLCCCGRLSSPLAPEGDWRTGLLPDGLHSVCSFTAFLY